MELEQAKSKANSVTILHGATIITMDSENRAFQNGGIVIEDDKIQAIGQSSFIFHQFSGIAHEIIDLNGHILLPGIVSTSPNSLFLSFSFEILSNYCLVAAIRVSEYSRAYFSATS